MLHYEFPNNIKKSYQRYASDISAFNKGELHDTVFTAKRVKMGIYLERNYKTYMARIRCAGNVVTPEQLRKTAALARQFGHPRVHVTTRAELQIYHLRLENTPSVLAELEKVNLSAMGGGGHTVRNILTNHDSGVYPGEVFDVQPYAIALTGRMMVEADSFELPRKLKTAFSSRTDDPVNCTLNDLGFIAVQNRQGESGFEVFAGGGLGAKCSIGVRLHEFISKDNVYHVAKAVKNVYHAYGNRRNKHRNRLRFLIHDDLGVKTFLKHYRNELQKIIAAGHPKLDITKIDNQANLKRNIHLDPLTDQIPGEPISYEAWLRNHVMPQKQTGLFSIRLPLFLGDLDCDNCLKLADLLDPFGENVLRCTTDQNFHIRNIPEKYLVNMFNGIREPRSLSNKPVIYGNIVPCTGAQTCQIGINYPRPAVNAVFKQFDKSDLDFSLFDDVVVRISGCPNSCANHWIADLGFYGKVRRVAGRPIPTYNVLGGFKKKDGKAARLGERVGWVHSYDLPRFISEVLKEYQDYKTNARTQVDFHGFWVSGGKKAIAKRCRTNYNQIPAFEEDKNYYFDIGAETIFSVKDLGRAECSAGIYDIIDVDNNAIRKNVTEIETWEYGRQGLWKVLKETVFLSTRLLLVTRGEEPKTEKEAISLFLKHFIETGLVSKSHLPVIDMVLHERFCELSEQKAAVIALAKEMRTLYANMDGTMRFPGEKENFAISREDAGGDDVKPDIQPDFQKDPAISMNIEQEMDIDKFKDLRGVKCPLNFAKTKIEMAGMKPGQILEIFLDDGDPIENVPGSVKQEGHIIHKQEKVGEYWDVVIEKV